MESKLYERYENDLVNTIEVNLHQDNQQKVMCKKLKDSGAMKQRIENQYKKGVLLGHIRASNNRLIGTCKGLIQSMTGTLARPDPEANGTDIPTR